MVAFEVKRPEIFAFPDACGDAVELVVGQVQALDVVALGKVDFADAASVQADYSEAVGRKQRLVDSWCLVARKVDNFHLIIFGEVR